MMTELVRFGVSVPSDLIQSFDKSTEAKGYTSRSEAIRDMMRDYLVAEEWQDDSDEVIGTVTIVFNHDMRDLATTLNTVQHQYHSTIVCAMHVHVDEHNCLEVIAVRGKAAIVRTIADLLISVKGVKHGKLVMTTTGQHMP